MTTPLPRKGCVIYFAVYRTGMTLLKELNQILVLVIDLVPSSLEL